MAEFPYFRLWTDAYLGDTMHLSLEEHGAYLKLLIIAWRTPECSLPDDDVKLARMLGVTVARWRGRLRPAVEPFWTVAGGRWTQKRLLKEREKLQNYSEVQSERAKQRWDAKSLGGQETPDAGALPARGNAIQSHSHTQSKKEKKDTPLSAPPKRGSPEKGCRLPDGFEPDLAEAERIGLSRSTALIEAEKFRDFWRGKPGKDGRKSDWPATWRNWCRKATETRAGRHASPAGPTLRERMLAAAEEAVAAKEAREAAGRTLQ